jgi:hypothetical protein
MNPISLHDIARAPTTDTVRDLLRHWRWEILLHLPYCPDMSLSNWDLFAKMKERLQGTRGREEIIHPIGQSLLDINRSGRTGVRHHIDGM